MERDKGFLIRVMIGLGDHLEECSGNVRDPEPTGRKKGYLDVKKVASQTLNSFIHLIQVSSLRIINLVPRITASSREKTGEH